MTKGKRLIIFLGLAVLLLTITWFFKGTMFPQNSVGIIIFTSLLMLSFNTLILEHYFTKPTDVIASSIAILLAITPLRSELINLGFWYDILFFYCFMLIIFSITSLALFSPEKSENSLQNKFSMIIKDIVVRFGSSKVQFFSLFMLTMFFYIDSKSTYFIILFLYSGFVLVDPWKFFLKIPAFVAKKPQEAIGQIFGVQSKNTFLVKLIENRKLTTKIFDFVEFKYSIDNQARKGLILDVYLLNQEQWIKVLTTQEIEEIFSGSDSLTNHIPDMVYKITNIPKTDFLERFIGLITENSTIEKIKFIYNSRASIVEGQLLEVKIRNSKVLYQVVEGTTKIELLENKNQTGQIIGEAIQLGTWSETNFRFEQFGWVPSINNPIYLATKIEEISIGSNEFIIGCIPETNYPVILNKEIAITHHTAILGVTGSGKSVFVRNLIKQVVNSDTKVIIIDLTGEYSSKISDIRPIITDECSKKAFDAIEIIAKQEREYANKRDYELIKAQEKILKCEFYKSIKLFLEGDTTQAIFELPDISNSSDIIEYTKWFFWVLFKIAKSENSFGKRICVVLEEAHTIVPELNSMGVSDFASKATVNSIAQIALQGRKYNIGFWVIAQRTANVSKTVLTQCNSIIAFQEFDKTSSDFLSNYLGTEYINTLPSLKFRQAIAVGKAFKSNVPMIFEIPNIEE